MKGDQIIKDIATTFNLNYQIGFQEKIYCSSRYGIPNSGFLEIYFMCNRWSVYYYVQTKSTYYVKKSLILLSHIKNKRNRVKQFIAEILYYARD